MFRALKLPSATAVPASSVHLCIPKESNEKSVEK